MYLSQKKQVDRCHFSAFHTEIRPKKEENSDQKKEYIWLFSLKQEQDPIFNQSLAILLPMHTFSSVRQLISQIGGMNYVYQL